MNESQTPQASATTHPATAWPSGRGEMVRRIREHDWAATPLGPIAAWPRSLRTTVDLLLAHGFPMALHWGPGNISLYNDAYRGLLGGKHPATLGRPLHEVWPEVRHINEPLIRRAWAGETVSLKDAHFFSARNGALADAWYDLTLSPVRDGTRIAGTLVTVFETTERVLAEKARDRIETELRASEARQAFLLTLSDALRALSDPVEVMAAASETLGRHLAVGRCGYGEVDPSGGHFTVGRDWTDGAMASASGTHRVDDAGQDLMAAHRAGRTLVIDDAPADSRARGVGAAFEATGGARASLAVPLLKHGRWIATLYAQQASPRHWTPDEEALVREVAERIWAAVERARAEAALRESETRLQVLVAELQHRTRNLLTVVSVVAERTLAASGSLADFDTRFQMRLEALGRSQALLSRDAQGVELGELLRLELAAHGVEAETTVSLAGPEVRLPPRLVQMFGLALHELMTNALKYGALASAGGTLSIAWGRRGEDGRVWLRWEETLAVPLRAPPERRGFGRKLIEEVLPYDLDAGTRLEVGLTGVRCTIELPLST